MALGKRRREWQLEAFVVASDLPKSPGHSLGPALNRLLAENSFDPLVESLCVQYAETMGRPGMPSRQDLDEAGEGAGVSPCPSALLPPIDSSD